MTGEERELAQARYQLEERARALVKVLLQNERDFAGLSPAEAVAHPAAGVAMLKLQHAIVALTEAVADVDFLLPEPGRAEA